MFRLAIIGLGAVTRNIHLPAYEQIKDQVAIVGGCDPDTNAKQWMSQRHPVTPLFDDVEEMLAAVKPDIVAICTPPSLHYSNCVSALHQGCHVFCEKPMVETLEQADELIQASRDAGRHLVVNSQFPRMKIHTAAKEKVGTPDFGRLLFVSISQTFRPTEKTEAGWRRTMKRRLGFEFGIHAIDLARFFFEEDPVRILAHMPKSPADPEADLLNITSIEFPGGRAATIILDRLSKGPERYLDIRLDGEFAAISTSIGGELRVGTGIHTKGRKPFLEVDFALGGKAVIQDGNKSRVLAKDGINPFAHGTAVHLENLLKAIADGTRPHGDAAYHRQSLAMVFAAYEAAETGRAVDLAPYFAGNAPAHNHGGA